MACTHWTRETRRLWFAFLLGAGFVLGLAAALYQDGNGAMIGLLYPYYNYTAALEAAVFSACLAALLQTRLAKGKGLLSPALLWAGVGFCGAVLVASRSRGAFAAASVAAVFTLWRMGYRRLLAGLAIATLIALAMAPDDILSARLKLNEPGANLRPALWKAAVNIARERPFFGEGPGQFDRGFLRHNFPSPQGHLPTRYGRRSAHAHSEALQMAAETGWPGLALFLIALGTVLCKRGGADHDPTRLPVQSVLVSLLVSSLLDNIFALPALHWIFFSALAVHANGKAEGSYRSPRRPLYVLGLALAVCAWAPAWMVRAHRHRAHQKEPPAAREDIRRALIWSGEDPELWADLARFYMREGKLREATIPLAQAYIHDPTNAVYPLVFAEIFRVRGDWRRVLVMARRALALEPQCPPGRLFLAEALYHTGDRDRAATELQNAVRDKHPSARSHTRYVRLIRDLNRPRYEELRRLISGK